MPKLKVSLGIGFANAKQQDEIEIDETEWEECETEEEREKLIDQYAQDWAWNYIDIGAEIIEYQSNNRISGPCKVWRSIDKMVINM